MGRLEESEDGPQAQQFVVVTGPAGGESDERPGKERHRIKPADVDAVGEKTEEERTGGEGVSEGGLDAAVLLVREGELLHDAF